MQISSLFVNMHHFEGNNSFHFRITIIKKLILNEHSILSELIFFKINALENMCRKGFNKNSIVLWDLAVFFSYHISSSENLNEFFFEYFLQMFVMIFQVQLDKFTLNNHRSYNQHWIYSIFNKNYPFFPYKLFLEQEYFVAV